MEPFEDQAWHRFMKRFSILLAIKSMIVVMLCYFAGFYLSRLYHFSIPEIAGLWCLISGIIVLQVLISESLTNGWLRILGSFIGAFMSFIFSEWMGYGLWTLALCTFFIVIIASFFHVKHTFRLAVLTAGIIIIVGMVTPDISPFINASSRFIESAVGTAIAIAITALFFPLRKKLNLLGK